DVLPYLFAVTPGCLEFSLGFVRGKGGQVLRQQRNLREVLLQLGQARRIGEEVAELPGRLIPLERIGSYVLDSYSFGRRKHNLQGILFVFLAGGLLGGANLPSDDRVDVEIVGRVLVPDYVAQARRLFDSDVSGIESTVDGLAAVLDILFSRKGIC